MIRPVTVATFLLACGSGLYLYQSKHEVQVLDRTIERSVHDTNTLREQSRLLAAEWTMLNDPERLRQFSDTYLRLKTITPTQFSSLADLDGRLPAPRVETQPHDTDEDSVPVTVDAGALPIAASGPPGIIPNVLPVPPVPVMRSTAAAAPAARPAEAKVAARPMNTEAALRPATVAEPRVSEPRMVDQHVAPRAADMRPTVREPVPPPPRSIMLAQPRPVPVTAPAYVAPVSTTARMPAPSVFAARAPATLIPPTPNALAIPAPTAMATPPGGYGGSLLGMARGGMAPAPRPTPMNATYNTN